MQRTGIAMAALMIMTSSASAATPQDCAKIGEDAQRLACFDGIYPRQDEPQRVDLSAEEVTMKRRMRLFDLGWYLAETVSPIDDTRTIHAGKTADDEYFWASWHPRHSRDAHPMRRR